MTHNGCFSPSLRSLASNCIRHTTKATPSSSPFFRFWAAYSSTSKEEPAAVTAKKATVPKTGVANAQEHVGAIWDTLPKDKNCPSTTPTSTFTKESALKKASKNSGAAFAPFWATLPEESSSQPTVFSAACNRDAARPNLSAQPHILASRTPDGRTYKYGGPLSEEPSPDEVTVPDATQGLACRLRKIRTARPNILWRRISAERPRKHNHEGAKATSNEFQRVTYRLRKIWTARPKAPSRRMQARSWRKHNPEESKVTPDKVTAPNESHGATYRLRKIKKARPKSLWRRIWVRQQRTYNLKDAKATPDEVAVPKNPRGFVYRSTKIRIARPKKLWRRVSRKKHNLEQAKAARQKQIQGKFPIARHRSPPTWVHLTSLPSDCTQADIITAVTAVAPIGRVMSMTYAPPNARHPNHAVASLEFTKPIEAARLERARQEGRFRVKGVCPRLRTQINVELRWRTPRVSVPKIDGPQFKGTPPSRVLYIRGPPGHSMMREEAIRRLLVLNNVNVDSERVDVVNNNYISTMTWYFYSWRYQARRAMAVLRKNTDVGVWYGHDPCAFSAEELEEWKLGKRKTKLQRIEEERGEAQEWHTDETVVELEHTATDIPRVQ